MLVAENINIHSNTLSWLSLLHPPISPVFFRIPSSIIWMLNISVIWGSILTLLLFSFYWLSWSNVIFSFDYNHHYL